MKVLQPTEKIDFEDIVARAGFLREDFELEEKEDDAPSTFFAITGTVTVRRKSTGVSHQYSAGHGKVWLPDFEADLRKGTFGPCR